MRATLYDGASAHPYAVDADVGEGALLLSRPGGWSDRVEAGLLKRIGTRDDVRLGRSDMTGWRLILPDDAAGAVAGLLGKEERYGRWIDRVGLVPALAIGALATAGVVAIGHVAPHWIAPHVPMRWERNVGSAMVGDFGDLRCRNLQGQQALDALVERLDPGATRGPDAIRIAALDVPVFNAAALPGGYIVVFKTAITESDPDALAGIIAHEIAHIRRRHVTEAVIRELGIGAVIRLFAGTLGANAEQLVALSYTRDNEAQADSDAIAMLKRAGISPKPTADLFRKLATETGEGQGYDAQFLQSHPLSTDRAQKFAAAADPHAHYRPALSREQSYALFNICRKPKQ